VLLNDVVNPAEPHWFGINIQGNWSYHHVIKSLLYEIKDKLLPEQQQWITIIRIQSVHNRIKSDFKSQSMQLTLFLGGA